MQGLHNANLLSCVNIMIVSDHGMQEMSDDGLIGIDQVLDSSDLRGIITADNLSIPSATVKKSVKNWNRVLSKQTVKLLATILQYTLTDCYAIS